MKILYGVQGTGNGHISRANAISEILSTYPHIEVTWLLSGRRANNLFEVQGSHEFRRGLTFATYEGKISFHKTLLQNNPFTLVKDICQLDLNEYHCLVTDYEPVLSWAARLRGRKTIGIGHQYAFNYPVPLKGNNALNMGLLNRFAPADQGLGLHWHHFGHPILPPICDVPIDHNDDQIPDNKIVVYLPFEDPDSIIAQLRPLKDWGFYIYGPQFNDSDQGHIKTRSLSRQGFKDDLTSASGVITNTGFELISECLCLGIKVLTKPLAQQVEQSSNGAALEHLGYAQVVNKINSGIIRDWLLNGKSVRVCYPAVHEAIGHWLVSDNRTSIEELSASLWENVTVSRDCDTLFADKKKRRDSAANKTLLTGLL